MSNNIDTNKKILRVGIIGCGKIFQSHSNAYPDQINTVIVGFYDRMRNRAENWYNRITKYMEMINESAKENIDNEDKIHLNRYQIFKEEAKVYENVSEMLKNVDVVDICAPNNYHSPYAIWALKQNISVLSEKPAALCSLETKTICEVAKNSKGYYQINENFLWQIYVRELKHYIDLGKIGEIKNIKIKLGHGAPSWGWQNHFLNPTLSGGGVLSDMGFHALGIVFGIIGSDSIIQKIQSLHMKTGTKPERTLREIDIESANQYYLSRFMVEDDVKIKIWFKREKGKNPREIPVTIETSWAKTYEDIIIEGTKSNCTIDRDDMKRRIIIIYKNHKDEMEKEIIKIHGQGRDSHQLELIDFYNRISNNKKSYADEFLAHKMQSIVSGAYLSNLKSYKSSKTITTEGIPITLTDLDKFYKKFLDSGVPDEIILEEIVYQFMSPFTNTFSS